MKGVILAVVVVGVLFIACGGDDEVELTPEEAAVQQVFIDFVAAKNENDVPGLAALFSVQCPDREQFAAAVQEGWGAFRDTTTIEVTGIEFARLESNRATATPKATIEIVETDVQETATREAELVTENGSWRLVTCDYDLPGVEERVPLG